MATFVIQSWDANQTPINGKGQYVLLRGRQAGLLGWLLTLIGFNAYFILTVDRENISLFVSSLFKKMKQVTPLQNTCTIYYGYARPRWWVFLIVTIIYLMVSSLVISGIYLEAGNTVGNLFAFCLMPVGGIALLVFIFFYGTVFQFGYTGQDGAHYYVGLSPSIIENQMVTPEKCEFIGAIVQKLTNEKMLSLSVNSVERLSSNTATSTALQGREFYYADAQNNPVGPVGWPEIEAMMRDGRLTLQSSVISEGESAWSPISAVLQREGSS